MTPSSDSPAVDHHETPEASQNNRNQWEVARRCADLMWAGDEASRGLGMELAEVGPGRAVLTMRVRPDMTNGHGIAHGACRVLDGGMIPRGFPLSVRRAALTQACDHSCNSLSTWGSRRRHAR